MKVRFSSHFLACRYCYFYGSHEMVALTILVAGVVYSARIRGYAERDAVREAVE